MIKHEASQSGLQSMLRLMMGIYLGDQSDIDRDVSEEESCFTACVTVYTEGHAQRSSRVDSRTDNGNDGKRYTSALTLYERFLLDTSCRTNDSLERGRGHSDVSRRSVAIIVIRRRRSIK